MKIKVSSKMNEFWTLKNGFENKNFSIFNGSVDNFGRRYEKS